MRRRDLAPARIFRHLNAMEKAREVTVESSPPRFANGRVGFAIGDIHGRLDLLVPLLDWIERETAGQDRKPIVIFLGDYVDRGLESAGVLDLLSGDRLAGFDCRFLRGNHEEAMLSFLKDPAKGQAWLDYGGLETLQSYGVAAPREAAGDDDIVATAAALRTALPIRQLQFLEKLEPIVFYGDYAFAHAGVDPANDLNSQNERDLLWICDRFLNSKTQLSHVVVHGHTPATGPYRDRRRIGLDTLAYASGVLTCARFVDRGVTFHATTPRGDVRTVTPMGGL